MIFLIIINAHLYIGLELKVFLVGGAVRDELLNISIKDKDYVVIGATAKQLLDLKYQQVGKDFPVFLHPKTREEYALARTEKKVANGHKGFQCIANPNVTLEEDLLRRDLTINAIAKDANGTFYDPFNGFKDIKNKVLRHVSPAFTEDPLRVLRVARFAAKLAPLGFTIAPETMTLMQKISQGSELNSLPAERVWLEFEKALATDSPQVFIQVLIQCDAFKNLFLPHTPDKLKDQINNAAYLALSSLEKAVQLTEDKTVRFITFLIALENVLTKRLATAEIKNKDATTKSLAKEKSFENNITSHFINTLSPPKSYFMLFKQACEQQEPLAILFALTAMEILTVFDSIDVWRKPEQLTKLINIFTALHSNKQGIQDFGSAHGEYLKKCYQVAKSIEIKPILLAGFRGGEIHVQLKKLQVKSINTIIFNYKK